MAAPDLEALSDVLDSTWPAAKLQRLGPWIVRDGQGGGKRVSSVTAAGPVTDADIPQAEAALAALDQPPLFMIRQGDEVMDAVLAARGYRVVDPVVIYLGRCADMIDPPPPRLSAIPHWPPLAITEDIWAEAGIGPARIAVMRRATGPKTVVLGRTRADRPAGVAFVAIHDKIAMLHALEVIPDFRRQGTANHILRQSAIWAQDQGAEWFSLVVTAANENARRLYASLNMQLVGHYHYRMA
ncbi:MAG: GNAT family N-acetyltransferase [Gemmobacter sp.]|nr:GNAT family N-acetyltransferase [Gemmobacter sp.]